MTSRKNWIDVDLDGLRKLLADRGKEFIVFELVQNAWDEDVSHVDVVLTRPINGRSDLVVVDDSPEGFRNLSHAYTMYAESYKKAEPSRRGRFNQGEKAVLALCDEATITSTSGQIVFSTDGGRRKTKKRREAGTEFRAVLRLSVAEWEEIGHKVQLLLPDVPTWYNGVEIPIRTELAKFNVSLPTVTADEEGNLRKTLRSTLVRIFEPRSGETPMLYEMGIPVVETGISWHVCVEQKVPLNSDRDNVTPAYCAALQVAVLNHMASAVTPDMAAEPWIREAAGDGRVTTSAFTQVIKARFGENSVCFDPSDIGSNKEAVSRDFKVISGGSLSSGEWNNVRRTGALVPAGQVFPTNHKGKTPDKTYSREEWSTPMETYARFVEGVSPELVGHKVTITYIHDPRMVCGQFFGTWYNVNLAHHDVENWKKNIELMLHELAHTKVRSNDHLNHLFYETVGELGATLTQLALECPELFVH